MTEASDTPKRSKRTAARSTSATVLTAEERAAMKELARERKAQARGEDDSDTRARFERIV